MRSPLPRCWAGMAWRRSTWSRANRSARTPAAWATAITGIVAGVIRRRIAARAATAPRSSPTSPHVGQPMAANVVSATVGDQPAGPGDHPPALGRQPAGGRGTRWALRLLTVAPHAVVRRTACGEPVATVRRVEPAILGRGPAGARGRPDVTAGIVASPTRRWWSAAGEAWAAPRPSRCSTSWPACSARRWACRASRPAWLAAAHLPDRPDGDASRPT